MAKIQEWVYNPTSEKKLTFTVNSLGLRKYLDKKMIQQFKGTSVYYKWERKVAEVYVEKGKKFKQTDFLKGYAKKDVPTDQEMVACLGFADVKVKKTPAAAAAAAKEAAPVEPVVEAKEEAKKEETKKPPARPAMSYPQTQESVLASLNDDERTKLTEMFDKETGFTKVIQMLIDSKKPFVGHNP